MYHRGTGSRRSQRFSITLILTAVAMLTWSNASAAPIKKFIGFQGDYIDARHGSYLLVHPGALGDGTIAEQGLDDTLQLVQEQGDYIDGLSTIINDPSGEWVKSDKQGELRNKVNDVKAKLLKAQEELLNIKPEDAMDETTNALDKLGELCDKVEQYVSEVKLGSVAHDHLLVQADAIEQGIHAAQPELGLELEADSFEVVLVLDDAQIQTGFADTFGLLDAQ